MNWKEHLKNVKLKIARCIGVLYRVKHKLNIDALISIYYALIYSHLNYCIQVWGTADRTYLKQLLVMQNKFLRLITNSHNRTTAMPLFFRFKLLNVFDIFKLNMSKFVWSVINNMKEFSKGLFNNYFRRNTQIHQHNTRFKQDLHANKFRTNIGKKSTKHQGQIIWNSLPGGIRNALSIAQLKCNLKTYLINEYQKD